MKTVLLLAIVLATAQNRPEKNDPNGRWEAETGTQFELQLSGDDRLVEIVEGSHPVFAKYEVLLKNSGEVNTYTGSGYFVAKMKSCKDCKFDTDWEIIVVQNTMIIGATSTVVPYPDTCDVTQRGNSMIVLKKKT